LRYNTKISNWVGKFIPEFDPLNTQFNNPKKKRQKSEYGYMLVEIKLTTKAKYKFFVLSPLKCRFACLALNLVNEIRFGNGVENFAGKKGKKQIMHFGGKTFLGGRGMRTE